MTTMYMGERIPSSPPSTSEVATLTSMLWTSTMLLGRMPIDARTVITKWFVLY